MPTIRSPWMNQKGVLLSANLCSWLIRGEVQSRKARKLGENRAGETVSRQDECKQTITVYCPVGFLYNIKHM